MTLAWGGFGLGIALGFAARAPAGAVAVAALVGAGCLPVAAAVAGRRPSLMLAVVVVTVFGVWRGAVAVPVPGPARIDGNLGSRPVVVLGTVRSATPGAGSAAIVDARRVSDADSERFVSGGVLVSGPNVPALAPGDDVEVDASSLRAPGARPGPESEAILEREGVQAIASAAQVFVLKNGGLSPARVVAWIQGRLIGAVNGTLPEPQAALLLGIAFGIHQTLAGDVRAPLQNAGLIHIVVVSGLKVVMLLGLVAALAEVLAWSHRRTIGVAFVITAGYVLVSGAGPAAVRSAVMAGAAMLAAARGRRTDPLPMLALVAAVMLGASPELIEDPGFQLSFLGTAGILVFARPIASRIPGPRLVVEPFAVTVAAQAATVPVMADTFGVISLVGPIGNALVLPMLPAMIVIGGAGAVLAAVSQPLGWLLLQAAGLGATLITVIARGITAVPGAAIQVGTWPAAWTVAEVMGLVTATAVVMAGIRSAAHRRQHR